jgi:hypothetical protein
MLFAHLKRILKLDRLRLRKGSAASMAVGRPRASGITSVRHCGGTKGKAGPGRSFQGPALDERIGVAGRQTDEQFDAQICARADFHGFISRVPAPTGSSKFDSETKLIALHVLVKIVLRRYYLLRSGDRK